MIQNLAPTQPRRRRAAAAFVGIGMVGSVVMGAAPVLADDTVPTLVVPTQNAPEAVAEKSIPPVELKLVVIRSKGAAAIAKRQVSLTSTQARLAAQKADCTFNGARTAEIIATSGGLSTHGAQLAATTDLATARALYGRIFTDFRVYLVVLPKAGLAMRCDNALESIVKFNESAAKVQAEIDAATAKGANTTVAQTVKNAAVASVVGLNPAAAVTPCMTLAPDKGDKNVQTANAAALQSCDASLDSVFASLKFARTQLGQARTALHAARVNDRETDKAGEKATRDADKDRREAEREAAKELRETQREAAKELRKTQRDAGKTARKIQHDAEKAAREAAKQASKS